MSTSRRSQLRRPPLGAVAGSLLWHLAQGDLSGDAAAVVAQYGGPSARSWGALASLLERGLIGKRADGVLSVTPAGHQWYRQDRARRGL